MPDTVFLVKVCGFDYDDESYYANGSWDTVTVFGSRASAETWVEQNGWARISGFVIEDEYWDNDAGEYRERDPHYWNADRRREKVNDLIQIAETPVLP